MLGRIAPKWSHPMNLSSRSNDWSSRATLALILSTTVTMSAVAQRPPVAEVPRPPGGAGELSHGSPARVAVWHDSLEQVALRSPRADHRVVAILGIASPGSAWAMDGNVNNVPTTPLYPGIVARLRRIYPHADAGMRERIVSSLLLQAERAEAIAFLGELARTDHVGLEYPIAATAVEWLSHLGTEGAEVLRVLHASGQAIEVVRKQLDGLARTGYRKPPGS
jgi:hypothetical protein